MINADDSQEIKEKSPGNLLLQARLQLGLTQEEVAKELYMTVYKVKALENDDYSRLSSDTFARGYIRAYANLVKVDVIAVLAAYDELMDRLKPVETVQNKMPPPTENSHRGAWQFLAVIGIFFIALWLISVWFFDNHSDDQYLETVVASSSISSVAAISADIDSSSATEEAIKSDSFTVASAAVGNSASSARNITSVSAGSGVNVTSSAAEIEMTSSTAGSSSSSKKTSLDELSFSFREESWLEVSDSRGDVLATELQSAGSQLKLVGLAPFDVKLGNAPAVDVHFNSRKVDIIPSSGSKVLTLKIGN